jgi:hypothetical protein
MIDFVGRPADAVLGAIPPMGGVATVEQVAINCAMAGCPKEVVPLVLSAIEALLDPAFDLSPAQVTTNGCAPLVIVSGPIVDQLGFNTKEGGFAGISIANASVGRAVRLVLRNIGGSVPGETSAVVHGHPGWSSYCVAEAVDSPWTPLHVARGFAASDSCVTVFFCQAPFALYTPGSAERVLRVISATLPTPGINMYFGAGEFLLVFSPKVAQEIASRGMTRADVQQWVWDHARYEVGRLRAEGIFEREPHTFYWGARKEAPNVEKMADSERLPMVDSPEKIHVMVNGGSGQWWVAFCAGWGEFGGQAVTRRVL